MAVWLFDEGMAVGQGSIFEWGPAYELEDGDTVFVRSESAGVLVGEFNWTPVDAAIGVELGSDASKRCVELTPHEHDGEVYCIEDADLLARADPPQLDRPLVKALEAGSGTARRVDWDVVFDGETVHIDDDTSTVETEHASDPLETVFVERHDAKYEDFSHQQVRGRKRLTDVSLRGANLSGAELEGVIFENVDLSDVDFGDAELDESVFTGHQTRLAGANFSKAQLTNAVFEVDLTGCRFDYAQLREADLREANIAGADFSEARLHRARFGDTRPKRTTFDGAEMTQILVGAINFDRTSFRDANLSETVFEDVTFDGADLRGTELANARFEGCRIEHTDATGVDLTNASVAAESSPNERTRTRILGSNLEDAVLVGATLRELTVERTSMGNADLGDSELKDAIFEDVDFTRATFELDEDGASTRKLADHTIREVQFVDTTFEKAKLRGRTFENCSFERCSFVGAELSGATFIAATLEDVDFSEATLTNVTFEDCDLEDVNFTESKLDDIKLVDHETENLDFARATLAGADLSESTFESARFVEAQATKADFGGCDLSGTTLSGIRANRANFARTDLEYGTLTEANLMGADFTDARLYACQLQSARVGGGTGTDSGEEATRERTDFDDIYDYTTSDDTGKTEPTVHPARKNASVYRTLESLFRENSLTEKSLKYHRKRKNAILSAAWSERHIVQTVIEGFSRITTEHGTQFRWLFIWVIVTTIVPAFFYARGAIRHDTTGLVRFGGGNLTVAETALQGLLFSLLSFTGLGYGRFTPTTPVAEFVATAQTGLGVLFFGLLVFILSTRASR
jgi:uncharacterized protein YjbI with pentapeptide repeats